MKAIKILAGVLVAYVAVVVAFETLIGVTQPAGDGTLVITTTDDDGATHRRVLSSITFDGQLYVAANHWPRAWYNEALANPDVVVEFAGTTGPRRAVPVSPDEHARIEAAHGHGLTFKLLTGFPPRRFMRLDAVAVAPPLPDPPTAGDAPDAPAGDPGNVDPAGSDPATPPAPPVEAGPEAPGPDAAPGIPPTTAPATGAGSPS